MKKILFLCPYPADLAPSQRFRYEQYLSQLQQKSFKVVVKPFLTTKAYSALYQSGNLLSKIHAITHSYFKRCSLFLHASQFDFVFIHREVSPAGPPLFEWVLAKVMRKKIIYDFDDAIWLTDKTDESSVTKMIRWRRKVRLICRWSYKVSCGNAYLANFAKQFNANVMINPTTLDTLKVHKLPIEKKESGKKTTIGWTGSRSTLKYLNTILPVLESLEKKYPQIEFLIISDVKPKLRLKNFVFKTWRKETEISDLSIIDIGIMPLPDDDWTKGKCGFKALQYMAMAIPAVVSAVGVNKEIVQHGREGFCCTSHEDWFYYMEELIINKERRIEMGRHGRLKVIDHYSVASNSANFLSLFQ